MAVLHYFEIFSRFARYTDFRQDPVNVLLGLHNSRSQSVKNIIFFACVVICEYKKQEIIKMYVFNNLARYF